MQQQTVTDTENLIARDYLQELSVNKYVYRKFEKTLTKHIWSNYLETVEDIRHTPEYKALYERRKETIVRVFADAKEKYAMRYTPYRGLTQVSNWVRLKFACMNLKKYAIYSPPLPSVDHTE